MSDGRLSIRISTVGVSKITPSVRPELVEGPFFSFRHKKKDGASTSSARTGEGDSTPTDETLNLPRQRFLQPGMRRCLDLADSRGTDAEHQSDLLEVQFLDIIELHHLRLAFG